MNAKQQLFPYLKQLEKPGRYIGGEYGQTIKDKKDIKARYAFLFPDAYEIGMSNLGLKILYNTLNKDNDVWCERVYAPWPDAGKFMKEKGIPLYTCESGDAVKDFDFLGITVQYEMCYTNILYCLELADIPLYAHDRDDTHPIVVGGGPCTYNPEPIADFFDVFSIGEGEESSSEMVRLYIDMKENGTYTRENYLRAVSHIEGMYVPSLYNVTYEGGQGTPIAAITPKFDDVPKKVTKRIMVDFDKAPFPQKTPVPCIETVHDRIMLECARGCIRGCRFCQAGMIYRPYREKTPATINKEARDQYTATGYEEISLTSLSISDYKSLKDLVLSLKDWTDERKVGLSLPSMRVDAFEKEIMALVEGVRKSGLTFAAEAGSERLRNVINKNLSNDEILSGCRDAFSGGRTRVKLYFMIGLPTETDEDVVDIARLSKAVVEEYYHNPQKPKGKSVDVTASASNFVPKAHTPFQWFGQDPLEELLRKQKLLVSSNSSKKIRIRYHEAKVSFLEAVFSRGDRRLSAAIVNAYKLGAKFDGWDEHFSFEIWQNAFAGAGIDPIFYANRRIPFDEVLPWEVISCGVTTAFLKKEAQKALEGIPTPDCRTACSGCGAACFGGELCKDRKGGNA